MPGPDDLLPPNSPPAPVAPRDPEPRTRRIVCGFCDSELDPQGAILRRGESAGGYLDLEDQLKKANATIDTLQARNTELAGQLEAATSKKVSRFSWP